MYKFFYYLADSKFNFSCNVQTVELFGELTAASSENYRKGKNKRCRKKAEMVTFDTGGTPNCGPNYFTWNLK